MVVLDRRDVERWFGFEGDEEEGRDGGDREKRRKLGVVVDMEVIEMYVGGIFVGERLE